ncbi:MAG: tRNA (adenosine(37)-N6)-threonylcarbamoyltransferase complex dimerization subunit type 1 TsaB, partial [Alphaproteobacteria bacterium]|nr:tRNA (adenosine(37)-N6)-threonylcarbamoyltransferase complex dimerization subunit type 1 TsaB [Alphaproteobacteria bacterium]
RTTVAAGARCVKLLAFDTALGPGSVAVWQDGRILGFGAETTRKALAEELVPLIETVLAEAGTGYAELDRLAVTVGPGTFTGLRVGLATARGLALATGLPLVGLSTLEVLAWPARPQLGEGDIVIASIDARRGELFQQAFRKTAGRLEPLAPPLAYPVERAADVRPASSDAAKIYCLGSGAELLIQNVGVAAKDWQRLGGFDEVDARALAEQASLAELSPSPPEPLYLREPDAKLPKDGLGLR